MSDNYTTFEEPTRRRRMDEVITDTLTLLTLPDTCGVSIIMFARSRITYHQIRHPRCLVEAINAPYGDLIMKRFNLYGAKVREDAAGKKCDACGEEFQ